MPKSANEKAAEAIVKHFDSGSLNNRLTAYFTITGMNEFQRAKFFDFILCTIDILAGEELGENVTMDRVQRYIITNAMKEAVENEGYTIQ